VTDPQPSLPAGLDHAVLTCVDPLVDLGGVAAMAGAPARRVARWLADDERFPQPVGELSGGPVFGYGAVCDYLDVRAGRGACDAFERAQIADGGDDPTSVMTRMARAGRAPLLAGRSQPAFVTPLWEPADPQHVLAGGQWVAAVFAEQPDRDDPDEHETYQVLAPVALAELMDRRDWLVWLTMHVQTMREMHEAAAELLHRAGSATGAGRGRLAGEATSAATSLLVMTRALAAATVLKGTDPQCPHPHLCEAFALASIYAGELAALGRR